MAGAVFIIPRPPLFLRNVDTARQVGRGNGNAKLGGNPGVIGHIAAFAGDESDVARERPTQHLGRHFARLPAQRDILDALGGDAAVFNLFDFAAKYRLAGGVRLVKHHGQVAYHGVVGQVGQAVNLGQQAIQGKGNIRAGGNAAGDDLKAVFCGLVLIELQLLVSLVV